MKQTIAILLVSVILLGMVPFASAAAGMDNFQKTQTYNAGQFADVKSADWFAPGVQSAFELGLMKGSSDTAFKPTGNLTVAEALTIACRLHSIYAANGETFVQGNPWYQVYVDYAVANKIMAAGQLTPTAQITREQFAYLMCGAIPESDLNAINTITEIPDEKADSTYGGFVYRLYNAGVLTGSDKYGTFKPTTAIQRGEVATIVTRMADKGQRKTLILEKKPLEVTGINLAGNTNCFIGGSVQWTASPIPKNAKTTFTWKTGNPGVATVDQNGKITGHKAGQCNITVTAANGINKTVIVTVAQGGTRNNPYPADGTAVIPFRSGSYNRTIKIKCLNVISGNEANAIVLADNRYTPAPNDNQEWRIYEYEVACVSSDSTDFPLDVGRIFYRLGEICYYTTSGIGVNVSDTTSLGGKYENYTHLELFPGASGKYVQCILIPKGSGDLILRVPHINKDENSQSEMAYTWVKCVPDTTAAPNSANAAGLSQEGETYRNGAPTYQKATGRTCKTTFFNSSSEIRQGYDAQGDGFAYQFDINEIQAYANALVAEGWKKGETKQDKSSMTFQFTKGTSYVSFSYMAEYDEVWVFPMGG